MSGKTVSIITKKIIEKLANRNITVKALASDMGSTKVCGKLLVSRVNGIYILL